MLNLPLIVVCLFLAIYETAGQVFDATNSDYVDSTVTYPPLASDPLLPPCCGRATPTCNPAYPYRSHDGSCNNLANPLWGVPNSAYSRLMPPKFADGISTPRMGQNDASLPSARQIRTLLFPTGKAQNNLWSVNIMQWGQFMAHDMSLLKPLTTDVPCCTHDGQMQEDLGGFCFPVKIPPTDPTMGQAGITCMNFTRTVTDKNMGCSDEGEPAKPINAVSAYLDLSNVYGNSDAINLPLRTLVNGLLKTEARLGTTFPPHEPDVASNCPCNSANENVCYKTGDSRSNQNPQLTILQIMFVREHNRIARVLASINPKWKDERLYQEARRINIAAFQHISYYEWLPILLGFVNALSNNLIYPFTSGFVNDYNSNTRPDVSNEHAHAAFREFHTQIVGMLQLMNSNRQTQSTVPITTWMNRPQILETGTNMAQLTVGMATQNVEGSDKIYAEQISEKLLTCQGIGYGKDMKALDIQRDRDHGLGYYNDYREYCGLKVAQCFDDYGDLISAKNIALLKTLYNDYRDVDVSVGGSLEDLCITAAVGLSPQVGPTYVCMLNEQFKRTRQADRFWYENTASGFTPDQLAQIRQATSAKLFCNNGDGIQSMKPNGFLLTTIGIINPPVPCWLLPGMDLSKWTDRS